MILSTLTIYMLIFRQQRGHEVLSGHEQQLRQHMHSMYIQDMLEREQYYDHGSRPSQHKSLESFYYLGLGRGSSSN